MQHLAALQVHQVDDDSGGPEVDGKSVDPAPVPVEAAAIEVDPVAPAGSGRVEAYVPVDGVGEDSRLAAQDREVDIGRRVEDGRLTRQPVAVAQELFGVGSRRERLHPTADLDDALVALAVSAAGGRNADL